MKELKKKANDLLNRYAEGEELTEQLLEDAMNLLSEFVKRS